MNKKGISTIVSTVLIISIGVLIIVSIFSVSDIFFDKVYEYSENKAKKDVVCLQDVVIDLQNSCYDGEDYINLYLASNGIREIDGFLVRLYSNDSKFNLNKDVSGLGQFMMKNVRVVWENKAKDVNFIEVFPKINLNEKLVVCSNAKKEFGDINSLETIVPCT